MSDLDIQRYVVSRLIQAENDYLSAQAEYWSSFVREFGRLGVSAYQMPYHVAKHYTATWYSLQWARRDCKTFENNYSPDNEPYRGKRK